MTDLAGQSQRPRMPRDGWIAWLTLLGALLVSLGGAWYYVEQRKSTRHDLEDNLLAITRLKVNEIVRWRRHRLDTAAVVTADNVLHQTLLRWLHEPKAVGRDEVQHYLQPVRYYSEAHEVLLVDANGTVVLSLSGDKHSLHDDVRQSLKETLRTGSTQMTDLHIPPDDDPIPHFETITPLYDRAKQPLGALLVQYEAKTFLYPLIEMWPTASKSAETLFFRRDGDDVLFLNQLRHRSDTALKLRIPLTRRDVPAVQAVLGTTGYFEGIDYRGVAVVSILARIPDTPWFMVAKVDQEEIFADWHNRAVLIWLVTIVVTLATLLGGWTLRTLRRQLFDLSCSEAELRTKAILLEQQGWQQRGINELNARLIGEQPLEKSCGDALAFLAGYLELATGVLYLHDPATEQLSIVANYAYSRGRELRTTLLPGEGLAGEASRLRQILTRTDLPAGYLEIASALGAVNARTVIAVPLLHDDHLHGVMEFASLRDVTEHMESFLRQAAEILAVSVSISRSRRQIERLLEESQAQSEELQSQQEELRVTNEELEEQARSLQLSEERLKTQQEELQVTNEELEEKNELLDRTNRDIELAREVLAERAEELAQASRYKSEFLANMSHELRTPLNSLLILARNFAENRQGNLSAEQIEAAGVIHRSGNDLLGMINDLLDLSRIEAGRMVLHLESLAVTDLAEALRATFLPLAVERTLELDITVEADAPSVIVTDRQRLEQVLRNLLANAIKFTESGSVRLTFARATSTAETTEEQLVITVTDTGIGIAAEQHRAIFEAFRQADGSIARKYGGTGLGLSICRELVRLLGGGIGVTSEAGKGSTFSVVLPVQYHGTNGTNGTNEVHLSPMPPRPHVLDPSPHATLLIVEPAPYLATALNELCRAHEIVCLSAASGGEALALLRQRQFHGLLLDLAVQDMSGAAFLQAVEDEELTLPPVIVHSPRALTQAEEMVLRDYSDAIVVADARALERLRDEVSLLLQRKKPSPTPRRRQPPPLPYEPDAALPNKTVLIVDDDMRTLFALSRLLADHDLTPLKAENGEKALALLDERHDIDLVLMDIMMPGMDGLETIRRVRASAGREKLPIIALTAKATAGDREQCLAAGASDYLPKPADQDRLLSLLRVWLCNNKR